MTITVFDPPFRRRIMAADVRYPQLTGKEQGMPETPTAMINTINPKLYVAFELGWNKCKLASAVDLGTKPRISTIRAGHLNSPSGINVAPEVAPRGYGRSESSL
jgi:hypothetical protein